MIELRRLSFEGYKEWLKRKYADSEQIGLKDGWKVPSTTYWLYAGEKPVGLKLKIDHDIFRVANRKL